MKIWVCEYKRASAQSDFLAPQVLVLLERVLEAQRFAAIKMREVLSFLIGSGLVFLALIGGDVVFGLWVFLCAITSVCDML